MPPVIIGPRCNRRVSCDASLSNARSESMLAANPLDPYNLVGASKRFTDPVNYVSSIAAYSSYDGGLSWTEAAPLQLLPGWGGTTDPVVAWDNMNNAYLVAVVRDPSSVWIGTAIYQSNNGGRTWGTPKLIHASSGDDKPWIAGDTNPASPHYGSVYAVWVDGTTLSFARTTDHGATWRGMGSDPNPGTALQGANDVDSPVIAVAADGTIYIVWVNDHQIKFVKSTTGGDAFSAPAVAADNITILAKVLPITDMLYPHFPGATFRVMTQPTVCTGTSGTVVVAWDDGRESTPGNPLSRLYYVRSTDGGMTWQGAPSGVPLLTGSAASAATQQDFHPQLISTPNGEIGCAFYELGPKGGGPVSLLLIDVVLAVSTDGGATFPNRMTITDQPWDPALDAPFSHGDPNVTFIGEYFGLAASPMGFFPFWTDTRTGVQEIFTARVAVYPTDLYIRDSSSDTGTIPSPDFHWEAPDLIVRRQQDGDVTFVNQDLLRDGVTEHYVYGRVSNRGTNEGKNVRLAVTVGNFPSLQGLPGGEFRYPQDWYAGDWNTLALVDQHKFLGESPPTTVPVGATDLILGPVPWPALLIPPPGTWHPCLLAEVRADNDDSAGGLYGCDIQSDPNPCAYGSYFWGNNNICQRNLSYAPLKAGMMHRIEFPFLVGSPWSSATFLEVIVEKGRELAETPMLLRAEPVHLPGPPPNSLIPPAELVLVEGGRVVVRVAESEVGELIAAPGTIWRPHCPPTAAGEPETTHGGEKVGQEWRLTRPKAVVGFPVAAGEQRKMTLSFTPPPTLQPGTRALLRIFQRNDRRIITGSVMLELLVSER